MWADLHVAAKSGDAAKVATVPDGGSLNIVVDVQVMQMTLKASHPQARRLVESGLYPGWRAAPHLPPWPV